MVRRNRKDAFFQCLSLLYLEIKYSVSDYKPLVDLVIQFRESANSAAETPQDKHSCISLLQLIL